MQLAIENSLQKEKYFDAIKKCAQKNQLYTTKYLDFGIKIIRILCYTPEISVFLEQQMPFVLRDKAQHFDATIVFWKIENVQQFAAFLDERLNPKTNLRMRIEILLANHKYPNITITDPLCSKEVPLINLFGSSGVLEAYDFENRYCYYAVENLEPEEFIKQGHLFVQQLNILLKTDAINLTHGAVFGYNGQGMLLCARGQRGKSTLTVHSMLNGCEYVSDDYQLLEQCSDGLYAYPIYSIITLSPQMYQQMYADFEGKFCSNNARKDKYVFNISAYHKQFKTHYPIKMCLFLEIVSDAKPSIVCCTTQQKARAIVQFVHSTVMQMRDLNDCQTIAKLVNMVKDLDFYKFNLCHDIAQNTAYLRQFAGKQLPKSPEQNFLPRFLLDITFDVANILDTENCIFYSMNKFATNLYELLLNKTDVKQIVQELQEFVAFQPDIVEQFNLFAQIVKENNLLLAQSDGSIVHTKICADLAKECDYKLSLLKFEAEQTKELIEIKKGK